MPLVSAFIPGWQVLKEKWLSLEWDRIHEQKIVKRFRELGSTRNTAWIGDGHPCLPKSFSIRHDLGKWRGPKQESPSLPIQKRLGQKRRQSSLFCMGREGDSCLGPRHFPRWSAISKIRKDPVIFSPLPQSCAMEIAKSVSFELSAVKHSAHPLLSYDSHNLPSYGVRIRVCSVGRFPYLFRGRLEVRAPPPPHSAYFWLRKRNENRLDCVGNNNLGILCSTDFNSKKWSARVTGNRKCDLSMPIFAMERSSTRPEGPSESNARSALRSTNLLWTERMAYGAHSPWGAGSTL